MTRDHNADVRAILDGSLFYDVVETTIRTAWMEGFGRASHAGPPNEDAYEEWRTIGPGGRLPGARIYREELRAFRAQQALEQRKAEQRATVFPCDLCGRSLQGETVYERVLTEPTGLWHVACWEGLSKYLTNGDGA